MSRVLLVLRHLQVAVDEVRRQPFDQVLFSPEVLSENQAKAIEAFWPDFHRQVPMAKRVSPGQLSAVISDSSQLFVAGWNCDQERRRLKGLGQERVFLPQNRLFQARNVSGIKSFTQFRNQVEKELKSNPLPAGSEPTEASVRTHLESYFYEHHRAKTYFETRNGLLRAEDSTRLSTFLSWGVLDVRYLWNFILDYEKTFGGNKSTYWIRFELLWREFFHHMGDAMGNLLFSRGGLEGKPDYAEPEMSQGEAVDRLCQEPLMKAAMRELTETGFLSNRMRQWFASSWIYGAGLDWVLGAQLFEQYLIDYDVYSNYGNWQYIAGVGHDPRGGRDFDLNRQLQMYDPKGEYLRRWL